MIETELCSLFWKGYRLVSFEELRSPKSLLVRLEPCGRPRCGSCGQTCSQIHETVRRRVRDCDLLDHRLAVELPVRRVRCPDCGNKRERIDWLSSHSRLSDRLVGLVERLCAILPVKHVAEFLGLCWNTVKRIDHRRLLRDLPSIEWSALKRLAIDEFALHKGHRYATVVIDADTRQVLWIGLGNSREAVSPFFRLLGERCSQIEAVAMDQNAAFDKEVKANCPNAEVVYDLFHVVAKYGREVIDRVRVDRANELKDDKPARKTVKRSRWLLLKNRENLSEEQSVRLDELMGANQPLATVYVLKQQLKELWYSSSVWAAFKQWRQWWRVCEESGLKPLMDFARKLKPYLRGILASTLHPLNTSVLEGVNNKIKVIKRTAYGFRDSEYFFLKIKHAFPGNRR